MQHHFDIDVAKIVGVVPAIMMNNFEFWIEKNRANNVHFHDGYYWTYNSARAMKDIFPYLSEKQIRTNIDKLVSEGYLITGNYNKTSMDRTLWYAITEKGESLIRHDDFPEKENACSQKGKSILPNGQMEITKEENGNSRMVRAIPDNDTDNKKDNYSYNDIVEYYNDKCNCLPRCTMISEKRKKAIAACSKQFGDRIFTALDIVSKSDFLSGRKGKWKANFDWIFITGNMLKILEGYYENNSSSNMPKGEYDDRFI